MIISFPSVVRSSSVIIPFLKSASQKTDLPCVPRENGYQMNDWIRNRIVFMLFYSLYKKDTKFVRIES